MSWQACKAVHDSPLPIRSGPRAVLLALADYAEPDGTDVYPKIDTLAAKVKLSRRQVSRHLATLREMGVLIVVEEGKYHDAAEYRIAMDVLAGDPASERHDVSDMPTENRHVMACHFCPIGMTFLTERHDISVILSPSGSSRDPSLLLSQEARHLLADAASACLDMVDSDMRAIEILSEAGFDGEYPVRACPATCYGRIIACLSDTTGKST